MQGALFTSWLIEDHREEFATALVPPAFKPDLTKIRLNDALCLCEMLLGTIRTQHQMGDLVELLFWAWCE